MRHRYLHYHGLYNHCSEFDEPGRIELLVGSLEYSEEIEEVVNVHAHKDEQNTQVDELDDANAAHGLENYLLVVSRLAYILGPETDNDLRTNINGSYDHWYGHCKHGDLTGVVNPGGAQLLVLFS